MAEKSQVRPYHALVKDSLGLHEQTKIVEGTPKPGNTAAVGTTDAAVVVGTDAGKVYGFFGYEHTAKLSRPENVDTAYKAGDKATIINGPGIILVASVTSAAVKGEMLEAAANGALAPLDTGVPIAIAEESVVAAGKILVRSLI